MRLTRDLLIKFARETANQRARVSRRIVCIYLTGSVLEEEPLLGGTTDIDLIIIHDSEPIQPREIVRLTDEIHLDIGHYDQSIFHHPRHLRTDPWLGPFIYSKPMVLHDSNHWFDFTQASTGAQFFQPDYVIQRAGTLAQKARQTWMDLEINPGEPFAKRISNYLKVLENAGNALVCLTEEGNPLTERRFIQHLPQRLQPLHQPELISGLINLLSPNPNSIESGWVEWEQNWKKAIQATSQQANAPVHLQPGREPYYERAATALFAENPTAAVWLLLRTWTLAAGQMAEDSPLLLDWKSACQGLGLDEEHFSKRLQDLDQYLDLVEETLNSWAHANGVSTTELT